MNIGVNFSDRSGNLTLRLRQVPLDCLNRVETRFRFPRYQQPLKTDLRSVLYHQWKVQLLNFELSDLPLRSLSSINSEHSPDNRDQSGTDKCTHGSGWLSMASRGERLAGVPVYGNWNLLRSSVLRKQRNISGDSRSHKSYRL